MRSEILVLVGLVLTLAGSGAYIRDTLAGRSRPNRATFALWALAPLIAATAEIAAGVGWAALPTLVAGAMPLLILIASFVGGGSPWQLNRFDYVCGALSLLALAGWGLTRDGAVAISLSIASDLLAAIPTLRKCWTNPETETGIAYVASGANAVTGLIAVTHPSFAALAFNVYLVAICACLSGLVYWPRPRRGPARVAEPE